MATKELKDTDSNIKDLEYCPIQKAIDKNKKRMSEITGEKPEVKKKSETKIKKLYPSYSKIALLLGSILVLGALFTSLFVPDIGHVIYAILESLDPFKGFRGNGNLEPDNYVMFLK